MIATRILKLLFCFKKPRVIQLSYLPVLIKDKPVLFVAWDMENVGWIKFTPPARRYTTAKNAVLLTIPNHLNQVTLKACNCWRKISIYLPIHAVQLEEAALAQLIDGFRPLNKTGVHTPSVSHIKNRISIMPFTIQLRDNSIQQIDRFNVTIQPIHYQ